MKLYRTAAAIGLVQGLRWLQHPMPAVSVLFREGFELYDLNFRACRSASTPLSLHYPFFRPAIRAEGFELYDLNADPHEVDNLFDRAPRSLIAALQGQLSLLKVGAIAGCSGICCC